MIIGINLLLFIFILYHVRNVYTDDMDDSDDTDDNNNDSDGCGCSEWGHWTQYTACSKQCGRGKQSRSRSRTCGKNFFLTSEGEIYCTKNFTQFRSCNVQRCGCESVCSSWSEWNNGSCTRKCGGGTLTSTRRRDCQWSPGCLQLDSKELSCNRIPCPECSCNTWSAWSDFNQCSVSCGRGVQTKHRKRVCHPLSFGHDCSEATVEEFSSPCNYGLCCKDICTSWSSWTRSSCTVTCDKGSLTKTRRRFCIMEICPDTETETESCKQETCPATCESTCTSWGNLMATPCSHTCGGGIRYIKSRRQCRYPDCVAEHVITTSCNSQACLSCSEACQSWSNWSNNSCSASCDLGISTRIRTRTCTIDGCDVKDMQENACKLRTCPATCDVDCTSWGSWEESACSTTCDNGVISRVRNRTCPHTDCMSDETHHVMCRNRTCPDTCDVKCSAWSKWQESLCSKSCDEGEQHRTRVRVCPETDCPSVEDVIMPCRHHTCLRTCDQGCTKWSEWQESACSQSCDEGLITRTRTRGCPIHLNDCHMTEKDSELCLMTTCIATCDGNCTEWTNWTEGVCSKSCDKGTAQRARHRQCSEKLKGCRTMDVTFQTCNMKTCQATCDTMCTAWSGWSAVAGCSVSCGEGQETLQRVRSCGTDPNCSIIEDRKQKCNLQFCAVSNDTRIPSCNLSQWFVPDPDNCTIFYQCVWGRPIKLQCPAGTGWNQKKAICDYKRNLSGCK